jgi:hypothetical protein
MCVGRGKKRLLSSIKGHDIKHEYLRVAWASSKWGISPSDEKKSMTLASAGADGQVKIWKSSDAGKIWKCTSTLDHCLPPKEKVQNDELNNEDGEGKSEEEEKEVPQIYALQFIDSWKG